MRDQHSREQRIPVWQGQAPPYFLLVLTNPKPTLFEKAFAFYNAPKLDLHLEEKYGKDYDGYAKKTKMLIPFN